MNSNKFAMEKKSTLNKRLKSYTALAGTLVAANAADAQIMYTDVSPDATVATGANYQLDLNGDATDDFAFQVTHGTYMYGSIALIYDYTLVVNGPGNATDTASAGGTNAHNCGESIGSSLLWDAGNSYGLMALKFGAPFSAYSTGAFLGTGDKSLGFRFDVGGNTHYGWARVNVNAASTLLTIKDYGYQATANTAINTCATPTGLDEELSATTEIFGNANGINVNFGRTFNGTITVFDVLGNNVAKTTVNGTNALIAMTTPTSGVYLVTVASATGESFTKKLFVK